MIFHKYFHMHYVFADEKGEGGVFRGNASEPVSGIFRLIDSAIHVKEV